MSWKFSKLNISVVANTHTIGFVYIKPFIKNYITWLAHTFPIELFRSDYSFLNTKLILYANSMPIVCFYFNSGIF